MKLGPGSICTVRTAEDNNYYVRVPADADLGSDRQYTFLVDLPRKYCPDDLRDLDFEVNRAPCPSVQPASAPVLTRVLSCAPR
jgi:hypothetical protein